MKPRNRGLPRRGCPKSEIHITTKLPSMIEPVTIQFHKGTPAAVIHLQISAVTAQGIGPAGPLFAHHLTMSDTLFDFEVGFPVTSDVKPTGRVRQGSLPSVMVAKSTYHGDYEGLYRAWQQFNEVAGKELAARGFERGSSIWENYTRGPECDPNPSTWRTELFVPLESIE